MKNGGWLDQLTGSIVGNHEIQGANHESLPMLLARF